MNNSHPFPAPVLDVSHLEMLRAIEEHGRLSAAAAWLNVTPSALSHRIREAERRLGIPLYERAHRRLEPTAAARYLAATATRTLDELARAEADSRRMTGAVRRVVRLATDAYRSYGWLAAFMIRVREQLPGIELQIAATGSEQSTAKVTAEAIDVAIAPGDRPAPHLRDIHLFDDELVFLAAPDHPLAGRPCVRGADLEGVDFMTYTRTPEPDREFARLFRPTDHFPAWVETIELPEAIVEMVASGLATTVLSRWAVQDAIDDGRVVASRVGDDGIVVPWHAFSRPGDEPAADLADLLATWCAEHSGSLRAT